MFFCEICEIFKNTYLRNICERLLLFKLTSTFVIFFDACLVALLFLERTLKKRRKDDWVRSFALLKSFLNRRFKFLTCLENDYSNFKAANFFLSLTHTHKNLQILLSFSGFSSQSNLHSENFFLIRRNIMFRNQFYI